MNQNYCIAHAMAAAIAAIALTSPALAQQASPAQSSDLADIIVTAQKRAENLQSTPLAITALGSEEIRAKGIESIADLTSVAPSLTVTTTASGLGNIQLFIRGIGDTEAILTSDSPIGLYVDGVIIGRSTGAAFDVVDLERVEVLRGPQGTLYGRNTIGGAVNLISRKPGKEPGFDVDVAAGNFDFFRAKMSADTGELGNSGLSARFTYFHKQRSGYVDDLSSPDNKDPGAQNLNAFRAAVRFSSGPVTIDYSYDLSDNRGYSGAFQMAYVRPDIASYFSQSPALGGSALVVSPTRLDRIDTDEGLIKDRSEGHTLVGELDLGTITFRSLSGYRKWKSTNFATDVDGNSGLVGLTSGPSIFVPPFIPSNVGVNPVSIFGATNKRDQHQFSQEFNVLGDIGDKLNYILGAYYFHEHSKEDNPQFFTLVLNGSIGVPLVSLNKYEHFSTSKALFGQFTYKLSDTLSVTGGLRYTRDNKHLEQEGPFVRELRAKFSRVNYSATVDWQATRDILVYGRVATGYKAGGFNARSVNSGYDPEKLQSFEVGTKADLFDRHLRVNLAAYYATHDDLQVQQFQAGAGGASSVTVNAGKARYWGVEGEITLAPTRGLQLGTTVGYVNRKFKSFLIRDPATDQIVDVSDSAHFPISAAWTVSSFINWDIATLPLGKLSARVDHDYRSRIDFFPTTVGTPLRDEIADGPRNLVNARLSLKEIPLAGTTGEISLWGRNIFDEEYRVSGIDFGALGYAGVVYGEPATYGVEFRISM